MVDSPASTMAASVSQSPSSRWQSLVQRTRTLSRYFTALAGQALISLFHFGLNVYLIRTFEPYHYGLFALAFVTAVMGASIVNALVATPVSVFTPGIKRRAPRVFLETLLATVNSWLVGVIALTALVVAIWLHLSAELVLAFSAFVAAYSARAYSRSFSFARRRPSVALFGDIAYVLFSLLMLLLAAWKGLPLSLTLLLVTLAMANIVALTLEFAFLVEHFRLLTRWHSLRHYRGIWLDARWALVGVITTLIAAQAHSFLVTIFSGPAAYAPLAAGFVLFGPIRIGLQSWQSVMRPELAVMISRHDHESLARMIRVSILAMILAIVAFAILIFLLWRPISVFLYAENYASAPMGWIVAGWCGVTLFTALIATPSGVLQAFKAFRILAMGTVYSAVISLLCVGLFLWLFGPAYTLLGLLVAEVFLAVFLLLVLRTRVNEKW